MVTNSYKAVTKRRKSYSVATKRGEKVTEELQNGYKMVTNSYKMVTFQVLQNGNKTVTIWLQKVTKR